MANWQRIETAPKDGTKILLWWDGDFAPIAAWENGEWAYDMCAARARYMADSIVDQLLGYEPTHWMPLPPPPTA